MISKLVDDLLHLEGGGEGLDQNSGSNSSRSELDVSLSEVEDVVPEPSLEIVLHLGKVEVRSSSSLDELVRVVKEEESEVEDGSRHGGTVDEHSRLVEMPSSRSNDEDRRVRVELVRFSSRLERDGLSDGVFQVDLTVEKVVPGRSIRVFEVGHESLGSRVESIDDHLPVRRSGNLNPSILQSRSNSGSSPADILSNVLGLRREGQLSSLVEFSLKSQSSEEELLPLSVKGSMQRSEELESFRREDLRLSGRDLAENLYSFDITSSHGRGLR